MNLFNNNHWCVLYVRSRQEKKTFANLTESKIDAFLPLVKTIRQWSDRKKTVESPLFPSYIFVRVSNKYDFEKIMQIKESCFFLKIGLEYAYVTEKEIETIKSLLSIDGINEITNSNRLPIVGNEYKINYGPLSDLECEVFKTNGKSKVVVRINSLAHNIIATIPNHYLSELDFAK